MNGQDKGQTVPRDTRFTRVWVKQQGRWRLVANHYSSQAATMNKQSQQVPNQSLEPTAGRS